MTVRHPWKSRRRKSRNVSVSVSFRAPTNLSDHIPEKGIRALTFGNRQKTDQNEGIFMSPPDVISYIPNREVDWAILVLACRNRGCHFVRPKDDGDKGCPMHVRIAGDKILFVAGSVVGQVLSLVKYYEHIAPRPSLRT